MAITKDELRRQFSGEWKKHYEVKALREMGFGRYECKKCKRHFWSPIERDVCEDSSCIGYEFIGNAPSSRKLGYVETWKEIEKYFTKNGHTSIPPYPTVARWRDDLYFTIASINDFQPYVVSGELEPPANPLIVPQPCIRFPDVSNVGVTGRHYTNFVMVGQHAFNTKKTGMFYWKDEALMHDMKMMKALGISDERITFMEDVWMGGGNFGPSMEYFSGGLELGNCVFMQYEIVEGTGRELNTKVIDMGAGLSRLAWVTHGCPDSYEVVYGSMVPKYKKEFGVEVDKKTYLEYAKRVGRLDIEEVKDAEAEVRAIEEAIGHPGFSRSLRPLQAMYASMDHLLTILFTTRDGMFPSNAGGGYNLRMILRRTFGMDEEFGFNIDYASVLEAHAKRLEGLFPTLSEAVESASSLVEEEKKKYVDGKESARGKLATMLKKGGIGENELEVLYKSHGIPPEYVAEAAAESGIEIKVPMDFYKRVSEKEESGPKSAKAGAEIDVANLPKTKALYRSNKAEFSAKVLGVAGKYVILDKSAFFPEGGGQAGDTGKLNDEGVLDTVSKDGVILHKVKDTGKFRVGLEVSGLVNIRRRKQISRHHTAEHLLNAACRKVLGSHVWQAGSGKTEHKAHLDITHYKRVTEEELRKIELEVNGWIIDDREITVEVLPRNDAGKKYGFRLYQGGAVPGKEIRVVVIEGVEAEACGGTHEMIARTGEIGAFRIIKREGVRDGIERISFKAGLEAIRHAQEEEELLKKASDAVSVSPNELPQAVERFFSEWKAQRNEIGKLKERLVSDVSKELIARSRKEGLIEESLDEDQKTLAKIAEEISKAEGAMVILKGRDGAFVCACGEGARKNAKELLELMKEKGAKGGGNEKVAMGRI
ncbi:alanine--tRNA ligase [Candidatus Micrarchaeota archaeon]|nr:alanine--tRNA ligase [Candidatus Micrarchaeota archaeon]